MHLHFEENISSQTECTLHSLSWMGKVPDYIQGETTGGWKLNRAQYYSEGWLASGNAKGIVGVTFTSHCGKYDPPNRSNFNLRGHRSEVVLVRWNEPYQKLATCDAQGVIFVWIKHDGRWSIELINDRNSQVVDFAWSHDGQMALICYCDAFVLVGSVAGQRYWSTTLDLDNTSITCGVWSPDDQKVLFGTADGQIIVMSSTGVMVAHVTVLEGMEITSLLWSCEKFNMDENERKNDGGVKVIAEEDSKFSSETSYMLAVSFKFGALYFMNNYDDVSPKVIHTLLTGLKIDWSNCGQYLAVGGFTRLPNLLCQNQVHFYSVSGELIHLVLVPSQGKPLTALCWGHNDRCLFVAAGHNLHVAWIIKHVPSLQYLCQWRVRCIIKSYCNVPKLPLPAKLCSNVQALFIPTIKSYIPDPFKLRAFVSTPPPGSERLFCTIIHHGDEPSGGHYTLYLEYLGGLIPLLKGKRASKLRPDFVIFDPRIKATHMKKEDETETQNEPMTLSDSSSTDSDFEIDGCSMSPRMPPKKCHRQFRAERVERSTTFRTLNELFYNDNLPESSKLVEVLSNIWGTKFRIVGTAAHLPEDLGNILYKTSLLHLQPRQMTVTITELQRDDSLAQDKNFAPAGVSAKEDDLSILDGLLSAAHNEQYENGNSLTSVENFTNLESDIISVDILTNHVELSSSYLENASESSTTNCFQDNKKNACMKTKLSPASVTFPQNNYAFITNGESDIINSNGYGGAHPMLQFNSSNSACQTGNGDMGVVSVSLNSNFGNTSKVFSSHDDDDDDGNKTINNSCNIMGKSSISNNSVLEASSAMVGDYFFNPSDSNSKYCDNKSDPTNNSYRQVPNSVQRPVPSFVDLYIRQDVEDLTPRWAGHACLGIRYADDDQITKDVVHESNIVFDSGRVLTPNSENPKRLYLEGTSESENTMPEAATDSKSLDTEEGLSHDNKMVAKMASNALGTLEPNINENVCDAVTINTKKINEDGSDREQHIFKKLRKNSLNGSLECLDITHSASLPSSPIHRLYKLDSPSKKLREEILHGRCKHNSPLFKRKSKYACPVEISDEECASSFEDVRMSSSYKNLESFQKAQMKHKLKKVRSKGGDKHGTPGQFVVHNKAPMWNENSQVYQLDFGGRVTQESAKNFQVEHRGKQVMQFGRIDNNAYTLDFQYPFTAIQAFAVALANVTQRLK